MSINAIRVILLLFFIAPVYSQVQEEVNSRDHIKSIIFKGPTEDQFPVVKIGEPIHLEFDDLTASEQDYYYKIVHCDYDWTISSLLKSQYLNGVDNQRIINYGNSYNTLQPYSNYKLQIPNNEVRLKVSGNYVLEIYNSIDQLQFSRRFVVYKDLVSVGGVVKRSRDFDFLNEKQVVQLTINAGATRLVNPKKEVKIAIVQNHHWPTALYDIPPQFIRYEIPYTYYPDVNGDFVIRTLQGDDISREAEYTNVHFSLPYDEVLGLDNVYIFGKHLNTISGNYHFTENNYLILVYYRDFGDLYDSVIGVGSANSRNITN